MGLREKAIHWLGGYTKLECETEGNRREQAAWDRFLKSAPQFKVETLKTEKVQSIYTVNPNIAERMNEDAMLSFATDEVTRNIAKFLNERGFITFTVQDIPFGKAVKGEVTVVKKEKA